MSEKSGFFDSHFVDGKWDRTYLADNFARYFASFIGNGVFGGKSNELMVQQKSAADMSVIVLSGQAWINGYWYENDAEIPLTIGVADGVLNRIDAIVLRWDNSERVIRLAVKRGVAASNPSAPTLQRDADFYELKLAQVYVKAGMTKITQTDIADTRLDMSMCGFVQGVVQQFDTTEFGKQLDSFIREFEVSNVVKMNNIIDRLNEIAGSNDISSLVFDIENLKDKDSKIENEVALATQTIGYSKKNLIPYPYKHTTKTDLGITWTDNGDGTIGVSGTAVADSYFNLYQGKMFPVGKYKITSGNGLSNTCCVYMRRVNKTTGIREGDAYFSYQEDAVFEVTEYDIETYDIFVTALVTINTSVSNVTLKPMLRRAEINNDEWEPFEYNLRERFDKFAIEDEDEPGCFYRINEVTKKKEWLNPPLRPGWWYPLVERWEGKPVYQMTLYAASLPNNSAMVIQGPANWDQVLSVSGYAYDKDDLTYYPFPIITHGQVTPIAVISRVESSGSIVITTNGDASHFEAVIIVKYLLD